LRRTQRAVEQSDDVLLGSRTVLSNGVTGTDPVLTLSLPAPWQARAQFYRVRLGP